MNESITKFNVGATLNHGVGIHLSMQKIPSPEDLRRKVEFESLQTKLSDSQFSDRLDKPLAYWTLPSDRGLPFAFLDRTVRELLETPYQHLASIPGIGPKKMVTFLQLLERIVDNDPSDGERAAETPNQQALSQVGSAVVNLNDFDPSSVSETQWLRWCESVARFNIGSEKLGRLAPSLQSLPTVVWNTPLSYYMQFSLSEIRQLKTHGVKRVQSVLTLFHYVNKILAAFDSHEIIPTRLIPKNILNIEKWIASSLTVEHAPSLHALREHVAVPLIDQVQIDGGSIHKQLMQGQLGVDMPVVTIREQSRRLGLTRPRIYQLLDDCTKIFYVRWPESVVHFNALAKHCANYHADNQCKSLIDSIRNLVCDDNADADVSEPSQD